MRWRENEYKKSPPMTPGVAYKIEVNMGYTAYVFPKGHRVRVSVSSAAAPFYVPSSNTGHNEMTEKVDPIVAQNTVHFAPDKPSSITLPVVPLKELPKNSGFTAVGPFLATQASQIMV